MLARSRKGILPCNLCSIPGGSIHRIILDFSIYIFETAIKNRNMQEYQVRSDLEGDVGRKMAQSFLTCFTYTSPACLQLQRILNQRDFESDHKRALLAASAVCAANAALLLMKFPPVSRPELTMSNIVQPYLCRKACCYNPVPLKVF